MKISIMIAAALTSLIYSASASQIVLPKPNEYSALQECKLQVEGNALGGKCFPCQSFGQNSLLNIPDNVHGAWTSGPHSNCLFANQQGCCFVPPAKFLESITTVRVQLPKDLAVLPGLLISVKNQAEYDSLPNNCQWNTNTGLLHGKCFKCPEGMSSNIQKGRVESYTARGVYWGLTRSTYCSSKDAASACCLFNSRKTLKVLRDPTLNTTSQEISKEQACYGLFSHEQYETKGFCSECPAYLKEARHNSMNSWKTKRWSHFRINVDQKPVTAVAKVSNLCSKKSGNEPYRCCVRLSKQQQIFVA